MTDTYNLPGYAYDVAVSGNYAYVANSHGGLQIIDLTISSKIVSNNPTLIGNYDTHRVSRGVAINGNYAYVADGNDGFHIIDISFLNSLPSPSELESEPENL